MIQIFKNVAFIIAFLMVMSTAHSQTINWSTATGLSGGATFVDTVINNFAGTGLNVQIDVNVVNGFPKIDVSDNTKVNISDATGAFFSLKILNGTTNLRLDNYQNLLQGEQIRLENSDGKAITIVETSSNGNARMTVDAVAMTGPLPSTIVENSVAIMREQNNGAGTSWYATMDDVTDFKWSYRSMFGTSANEGFSLTLNNIILPIKLSAFDVRSNEADVELNWETAIELNNDFFVVERSSNGHEWENIGEVVGKGTTSYISRYNFIDKNPYYNVTSYYRLKQLDFDGGFSHSEIRTVFVENSREISIYPNPASDYIYISNIDLEEDRFMLIDIAGRLYNNSVTIDVISETESKIELSQLPSGMYFISTNSTTTRFTKI